MSSNDTANGRTRRPARQAKTRTADERAAAREEQAAKIAALTGQLADGIAALVSRAGWRRMLTGAMSFHRYSLNNQLLIMLQAEDRGIVPSDVAGFRAWRDRGRQVRKGQRGLQLLAPTPRLLPIADGETVHPDRIVDTPDGLRKRVVGFKVTHVWDITQTDPVDPPETGPPETGPPETGPPETGPPETGPPETGPPETDPREPGASADPGPRGGPSSRDVVDALRAELTRQITAAGYRVEYVGAVPGLPHAGGATSRSRGTVMVKQTPDARQVVRVLAHELAHITLGHTEPGRNHDYQTDRSARGLAEVEAESVAYVVLGAHGVDTGATSVPYVAGWATTRTSSEHGTGEGPAGDADALVEEVRATAEAVTTAAHAILTATEPTPTGPTSAATEAEG